MKGQLIRNILFLGLLSLLTVVCLWMGAGLIREWAEQGLDESPRGDKPCGLRPLGEQGLAEGFQAVASNYTLPFRRAALEDMTVARVRIDGGNTDDSVLNFQKIRLVDSAGNDIWRTLTATASSLAAGIQARNAIDPSIPTHFHSASTRNEWIELTLTPPVKLDRIEIHNRRDCCQDRLASYTLRVYDTRGEEFFTQQLTCDMIQRYTMPAYRFPANCTPVGGRNLFCDSSVCLEGDLQEGNTCRPARPYNPLKYTRPTYRRMTFVPLNYTPTKREQKSAQVINERVKFVRIDGKNDHISISQISVFDLNGTNVAPSSTPSSVGSHRQGHHHHHHGTYWGSDDWGEHHKHEWHPIDGKDIYKAHERWWDWDHAGIYESSTPNNPWYELNLKEAVYVKEIRISQRWDWADGLTRLAGFRLSLLAANRAVIASYTLTADRIQTYPGPALNSCPAGYRKVGGAYELKCMENCVSGETSDNDRGMCYTNCKAGEERIGGNEGFCRATIPSDFTALNNKLYVKNCAAGDDTVNSETCRAKCAPGFSQAGTECRAMFCRDGFRLVQAGDAEDTCWPTVIRQYLNIARQGNITSSLNSNWFLNASAAPNMTNASLKIGGSTNDQDSTFQYFTEEGQIVNAWSRKCLDASTSPATGGATRAVWWTCYDGNNQKWLVDEYNRLRPRSDLTRCLTVSGYSSAGDQRTITADAPLVLRPCVEQASDGKQIFSIPPRERLGSADVAGAGAPLPTLPDPINPRNNPNVYVKDGFTSGSGDDSSRTGDVPTDDAAFPEGGGPGLVFAS